MACATLSIKITFVKGHGEPQVLLFSEEVKQTNENNNKINKRNDQNKKQTKTKQNKKRKTKTKQNKTENCECMFNVTSE